MATIKYWNGTAWELAIVGKQGPAGPTGPTGPAGQATMQRYRFTAAGGETSESGADDNGNTLAYTVGLEEVFLNGVLLVRNQDYTASNGTSITGLEALTAGDVLEVLAWGVFNVSNTISTTLIDAKADLLVGTAADTVGRLAVGSNNTVLTADSSTATGLKWAAPAASGASFSLLNAGGTSLTGSQTVTVSGISNQETLWIYVDAASAGSLAEFYLRINGDTSTNYLYASTWNVSADTWNRYQNDFTRSGASGADAFKIGRMAATASGTLHAGVAIFGGTSSGSKLIIGGGGGVSDAGGASQIQNTGTGLYTGTGTINSISIYATSTLDAGRVYVYGSAN